MNDYQQPPRYQQQPPAPQQQNRQQPPYHQPPKKRHTGLIVVIVILVVLVLGGLVSCFACGAAVDSAVEGDKASSVTSDGSSQQGAGADASMSAVTLYDEGGISVKATERGEQMGMAYYTVEISNDSKKNIVVSIDNVSVDGKMANTFYYEDVAKGKTADTELTLTDVGSMDDLKNVEGDISITDSDTYDTVGSGTFTIK